MSGNAGLHVQATCFNRRGVHVLGHGTRRPASCFNSKGVVSHGRGGCSRRMGGRSVTHARTDGRTESDGQSRTVTQRTAERPSLSRSRGLLVPGRGGEFCGVRGVSATSMCDGPCYSIKLRRQTRTVWTMLHGSKQIRLARCG
jgi:hypothetical protein